MPKKVIYLAGAINGCSDSECKDWREAAKRHLEPQFETLDPMRRDYRGREDDCVNEIVEGDLVDIGCSHLILASCPKPSWGTAMEIFYSARSLGTPVVAMMPLDVAVSPWLRYHTLQIVHSLDEAIAFIRAYYAPKAQYASAFFGREYLGAS